MLHYIRPAIQNYAWGCKGGGPVATSASINGVEIDPNKEYAEAWFGTHTSAPSLLVDADKTAPLSPALDLPLLKILGIRAPLSIQLHPDSGIAPFLHNQFPTIYRDPYAKPEMVIPITPLLVMMGVKKYEQLRSSIAAIPAVAEFIGAQMKDTSDADVREAEVIRVLSMWLKLSSEQAKPLVQKALEQMESIQNDESLVPKDVIKHLQKSFPLDVGVLAPIFLNTLKLGPGQALFVPPNVLHAYIDGDAVEIMNCSDNVIRAGLTPKLRDSDLLCKLLFADESGTVPNSGQPTGAFTRVYRPSDRVRDFELTAVDLPANQKTTIDTIDCNSMLLCTSGSASVSAQNSLSVKPGQCILCPPGISVEITTSDSPVTIYRANKNRSVVPDKAMISEIEQIAKRLPSLSGDELKKDALRGAELLRQIEQYIDDIELRTLAYISIGQALTKLGDQYLYSASRCLQKAVYIFSLSGNNFDSSNELPRLKDVANSLYDDVSAKISNIK